MPRFIVALLLGILSCHLVSLWAAPLRGTVQQVNGEAAVVALEGDLVPHPGDKAEIFFKLPGTDDEVSVAVGSVSSVEAEVVQLKIENASGEVAKDQLVRIESANPQPAIAARPAEEDEIDVPNTFKEAQSVIESLPRPTASVTPKPRSAPTKTPASAPRFSGRWRVQNENADYVLSLRQEGNRVTGSYTLQGGTLTGAVRGNTLVATWRQPGNRRGGSVRLRLSEDGKTLSGPWDYNPQTYASGLSGTGVWTFRREGGSP